MYIAMMCLEGSVSRNFDIGLDYFLWYVEEGTLEKNHKSYPLKKKNQN